MERFKIVISDCHLSAGRFFEGSLNPHEDFFFDDEMCEFLHYFSSGRFGTGPEGPVEVELWVTTNGPDTDFTAKLVDVYPPSADYPRGYAMNLTDGIQRCRYRESAEREVFLEPGKVVEVVIEPMPTSNLFRKGHRIRLDITSFDLGHHIGHIRGTDTFHHDATRPSHLMLPVVK